MVATFRPQLRSCVDCSSSECYGGVVSSPKGWTPRLPPRRRSARQSGDHNTLIIMYVTSYRILRYQVPDVRFFSTTASHKKRMEKQIRLNPSCRGAGGGSWVCDTPSPSAPASFVMSLPVVCPTIRLYLPYITSGLRYHNVHVYIHMHDIHAAY